MTSFAGRLPLLFVLFAALCSLRAATVRYSALLSDGSPMTNAVIGITPLLRVNPASTNLIFGRTQTYRVLSDGSTNITFATGLVHTVLVTVRSQVPPFDGAFTNQVPNSTNTYNATDLLSSASQGTNGTLVPYSQAEADALFLTIANWITGSNTLAGLAGSGGGEVSTAQLLSVSNLLWARFTNFVATTSGRGTNVALYDSSLNGTTIGIGSGAQLIFHDNNTLENDDGGTGKNLKWSAPDTNTLVWIGYVLGFSNTITVSLTTELDSLDGRVAALEGASGPTNGISSVTATNIARDFATNSALVTSNALWLAPYALSFPTGLVVYTHPRSGFFSDSSGTATATNQALIARWNDASGRGNHLTSTNTTARPRLIYEAGNPLAFFANGESQQASNVLEFPPALMINSRAFSVFFVLQPMATLTNLGILQASNNNPGIIIEGNGDERGVVSLYGTSLVQSHIQTRASWSVLGVVGDTNMARIYHHGESTNLTAYAASTASGGIIGRWVNQRPYYGKVASVLLFDRALPAQEAESVVAKLEESFNLSTPNRNRLIVIGDSIVRGDTTSNGLSYAQQVAKRLGPEWEIINLGLGGQYLSTIKDHSTNTIVPLILPGRRNVALIEAGSNDIKLVGASGEDTYTNLVSLAGTLTRAGAQVVVTDILPRQNDATFNTKRLAFNTLVTNNWATFATGYAPFAADSTIGDSGDEANTTYYSDTIHPTEQGAGIMANYTAPVILSLPLTSSSGLTTNANQFAASDTLTIKDGANLTNLNLRGATTMTTGVISGALRMNDAAVVTDEIASTNWNFLATPNINTVVRMFDLTNGMASVSDYVENNFQPLSTLLGNLAGNPRTDYTNRFVAGSNISLTTNSGGVVTIAATGSGSQTPWASDIDGAGYSLTNVASVQINGTGPSQLLLGTQNTAGLTVEAPSTPSTNGWGVKFFASASVQEIAPGSYNDWQMTNNAGAALTLVFTNAWAGQFGSVKLPGAASGGSDYAVTVVQPLGEQVRFHFPTNGATTFTRTNGQDCQLEYWFTRLNTTNVLNCALGRAIQ